MKLVLGKEATRVDVVKDKTCTRHFQLKNSRFDVAAVPPMTH